MSVASKESKQSAQIGLLRLLARIYLKEVDEELVSFLKEQDCLDVFGLSFSPWSAEQEDEAAVEYCRLFITPGVCVPLASAFLGGAKGGSKGEGGAVALMVPGILEQLDVSLEPKLAELPNDHLSLLFSLWALLLEEGEGGEQFKELCIEPWALAFVVRLEEEAQHPFYQGLAQVTRECLQS